MTPNEPKPSTRRHPKVQEAARAVVAAFDGVDVTDEQRAAIETLKTSLAIWDAASALAGRIMQEVWPKR